jgi:hypothetical protein
MSGVNPKLDPPPTVRAREAWQSCGCDTCRRGQPAYDQEVVRWVLRCLRFRWRIRQGSHRYKQTTKGKRKQAYWCRRSYHEGSHGSYKHAYWRTPEFRERNKWRMRSLRRAQKLREAAL